jgi:hypothetical protein
VEPLPSQAPIVADTLVALQPHIIPTGAKRNGGICCLLAVTARFAPTPTWEIHACGICKRKLFRIHVTHDAVIAAYLRTLHNSR